MPYLHISTDERSDEVQEIIGRAPSSIIRWGITVIACLIGVLLVGAGYFRYPEIIAAPVIISSTKPAVKLVAQTSGRINEIKFRDTSLVLADEIVAVIENPAKTVDVLYLKNLVNMLDTCLNPGVEVQKMNMRPSLQLGDLQADYAALYQTLSQYLFFINNTYYQNKISALQKQIASNNKLGEAINERAQLQRNILRLESIKDSSNKILKNEKVIAPLEYNDIQKGLLTQQLLVTDSKSSMYQNDLQKTEYAKSITDIEQQYKTEASSYLQNIKQLAKRIKGSVASWEKLYVLRSPIAGKLTYFEVWSVNQYIPANTPAFMIVPNKGNAFEIRAKLPQYKAGKIKVGQSARIKLQEYPYEEYGMLKAHVVNVSAISLDGSYLVRLALDNDLFTTLNKQIPASAEMTGVADLVTENKSLLQRIFDKVYGKMN